MPSRREPGESVSRYVDEEQFRTAVRKRFDFLKDGEFLGPEETEDRVSYSTGEMAIELLYDRRDGRVVCIVRARLVDRSPRAGLACLYVAAGLGPAQEVRDIARNEKQLSKALDAHAEVVRKLLPELFGDRRDDLLLECHGR